MKRSFFISIWAICFLLDGLLLAASDWANRGARWADRKARGK